MTKDQKALNIIEYAMRLVGTHAGKLTLKEAVKQTKEAFKEAEAR